MFGPVPIVCADLSTVWTVVCVVGVALVYGALLFVRSRKSARSIGPGKPVDGPHSCPGVLVICMQNGEGAQHLFRAACAFALASFRARKSARSIGPGKPVDGLHSFAGLLVICKKNGEGVQHLFRASCAFRCCPCMCAEIGPALFAGKTCGRSPFVPGRARDLQEEQGRCATPVLGFLCCGGLL